MRRRPLAPWPLLVSLLLGACAAPLASCTPKKVEESESLLVAGGGTVRTYLVPVVKAFMEENPTVNVVLEGGGSTAGLVALKHGAIDVAAVARAVTPAEDDQYLRDYLVARDGVAIIVNPDNPIDGLSKHELAQVFTGDIDQWKDVKSSDVKPLPGPIVLIGRERTSNVRSSVQDLVLSGEEFGPTAKEVGNAAEMITAVRTTPGAIGYVTLRRLEPGMKALKVDGVEMSRPTMLSGRYPLSRSFYLAVHLKASPLAEKFIEFTLGKRGQGLLSEGGLLEVY